MLKILKERWSKNEHKLRAAISANNSLNYCDYAYLVKLAFDIIYNDAGDRYPNLDTDNITVIDDGNYQGTLLFVIPFNTYQPTEGEYLMTSIGYGSCSGCDTLQSIQFLGDEPPSEVELDSYMQLCRDIICNTIKPYNSGWRNDKNFEIAEED